MPLDLQDLSPKPDFEAMESTQNRIPKLAVRGRTRTSHAVPTATPSTMSIPNITAPFGKKDSKDTLRSTDENTLLPLSPSVTPTTIAPWVMEEKMFEAGPTTAYSDSFTTSTNEHHSSETTKQPFRQEVRIVNFHG